MRKAALVIGGLAVLTGLWVTLIARGLPGNWSFTEEARVDQSTYFRLKFDVAYKGEPQQFDIVVGCNVHDIVYKDGNTTYDVYLS